MLAAGRDDLLRGAVGAGEGVGDPGRAMGRRYADDRGVGDDAGLSMAGDRDGTHAVILPESRSGRRRQTGSLRAEKISRVALDRFSV